jgi:hypothetical protein
MRCMGRLLLILFFIILIVAGVWIYRSLTSAREIPAPSREQTLFPAPTLIAPPSGFSESPQYTVPAGTEIKGVGEIDQGFSFVGTENLEFVTGYTLDIPKDINLAGFKLSVFNPELFMNVILTGLKAIGIENREDLENLPSIGDDTVGVTFTTKIQDRDLRVNGIIFRSGDKIVVSAVAFQDGQQPTVQVEDLARQLEQQITSSR